MLVIEARGVICVRITRLVGDWTGIANLSHKFTPLLYFAADARRPWAANAAINESGLLGQSLRIHVAQINQDVPVHALPQTVQIEAIGALRSARGW